MEKKKSSIDEVKDRLNEKWKQFGDDLTRVLKGGKKDGKSNIRWLKNKEKIHIEIPPQGISLIELEKAAIKEALQIANHNQSKAARLLRISRETLRYRLKKYHLS